MLRGSRSVRALLGVILLLMTLLGTMPATSVGAAGQRWCPPQTGVCVENAFYDFWLAHGQLEILGYPIDHARRDTDGTIFQYFERAIMEWHPTNTIEHQVQLNLAGTYYLGDVPATRQPASPCSANCRVFSETRHSLRDTFRDYWQANGGLAVFGYPLTEQVQERNAADGRIYTVQYFERNRFEYHPEYAGTRNQVLLGRLGSEFFEYSRATIMGRPTTGVPNYGGAAPAPANPFAPPAPSPPPTAPTPAGHNYQGQVFISNTTPAKFANVSVSAVITDNGRPVTGYTMQATWYYKTTTSYCSGVSDGNGRASCTRSIGDATLGYEVIVVIEATMPDGTVLTGEVSFTPR